MNPLDVRQLPGTQTLPEAPFPVSQRADFRVHVAPGVHRGIAEHAAADTSIEICGVLVGLWKKDADGPYADVTDYIRCDNASSKFAEVTFTHESWAQINQEMDSRHADSRIIGWYHSHPDFGIFLSDRDCFIQENFFSGAGQIAYVVDPVRKLEGVFAWRDGKPEPVSHYWVGDRIIPVEASRKSPAAPAPDAEAVSAQQAVDRAAAMARYERTPLDLTTLLSWLCLFLLGYLLAGTKTRWEQERIIEGAVAHYGVHKLMRLGFEDPLRQTGQRLDLIGQEVEELLNVDRSQLDDKQRKAFAERKQRIAQALSLSRQTLLQVEQDYGYSDGELATLARYVAAKEAELTAGLKKSGESSARKSPPAPQTPKTTRPQGPPPRSAVTAPPKSGAGGPSPPASTDAAGRTRPSTSATTKPEGPAALPSGSSSNSENPNPPASGDQ